MGFDDGQIILDSENGAYYAGQTVRGRMVFSQNKVKTIHGIYVDMKGFCKVHWTTQRSRRENNRTHYYTVHHDSNEEYFRSKRFLFGNESGEHHLQPGKHEFNFEFPIPSNCPSSFEGSYGHIRYRVKVVMVTSGIFSMNKDKWVAVKVHAPMDLNQNPYCREPMEFDLSSTYCCWCMSAGASEIMVRMPVSGYCPGQVIPMEVTCQNDSNVEIDEIKFAIKKDVTFIAAYEPGQRNEHDTVAEIKKGPIPGRTTRNWTVEMEVPALDMYNVDACRYIDITYHFKVSTEVSGCHSGSEETKPIIFGTIPLVGFQDTVQNPLQDQLPMVQNVPVANGYPPPPIINQPLPNSPYQNGNGYPSNTPYPSGNPGYPTNPNLGGGTSPNPPGPGNQPYPNVTPYPPNQPYPGDAPPNPGANPPYPGGNSPFPGANLPYPAGNSPYPPGNSPCPPGNSLYPPRNSPFSSEKSPHGSNTNLVPPYPGVNPGAAPPYPGANASPVPPYPGANASPVPPNPGANASPVPPYPGARQSPLPPYRNVTRTTPLKTGTIGFREAEGDGTEIPLLPPGAGVPYPTSPASNPYATASAPEPSTPGGDEQKLPLDDNSPYNPEFMKNTEKKDEKQDKEDQKDEKEPK